MAENEVKIIHVIDPSQMQNDKHPDELFEFIRKPSVSSTPTPANKIYDKIRNMTDNKEKMKLLIEAFDEKQLEELVAYAENKLKEEVPMLPAIGLIKVYRCEKEEANPHKVIGRYKIMFMQFKQSRYIDKELLQKNYKIYYLAILLARKIGLGKVSRKQFEDHPEVLSGLHKLVYPIVDDYRLKNLYGNPDRNRYKGTTKSDYSPMEKTLDRISQDFCKLRGEWRYFSVFRENEGKKAIFECKMPADRIWIDDELLDYAKKNFAVFKEVNSDSIY